MAFRFPLASVLRLREIEEQREERLLTQILNQIAETKAELVSIDQRVAEVHLRRQAELADPIAATQLHSSYALVQLLKEHRQAREAVLAQFELLREKQLRAYQTAHQGRELLSTMRDEQQATHADARARQDQKSLDDIFASRRMRH